MADLSFLIPARNEMFLARTIESILSKIRGDSEIIAVLDGEWADPPIEDHPRVTLIHKAEPIGQRAATNLAARVSSARYVCKIDAHCDIDEGFDVTLIAAGEQLGKDVTQIPRMYNLHAFNWRCGGCGHESYQGPTPLVCEQCKGPGPFARVEVWQPRWNRRTDFMRFDHDLHFQYHGPVRAGQERDDIADLMSSVGACFFMRRDRFWELGGLDEAHGSWGQFGTEIACKSWLSGGRHVVNKTTWFAHLFRTQGGDFGFPYQMSGAQQDRARAHSRRLWLENTWPGQVRPLSWLIDYFAPVKGWHLPEHEQKHDQPVERTKRLRQVQAAGQTFRAPTPAGFLMRQGVVDLAPIRAAAAALPCSKGLVYYTDNRLDNDPVGHAVRARLAAMGLPIVCVSLRPLAFGDRNIVLTAERGHLTMFRQILAGLEALDTEVAFLVEHDVLYAPEHFAFTPPRPDTFYFNQHRWQVSARDGRAVHYLASQTSGCCAYRTLLVEHYRKRVAHVEAHGWDRNLGYEPGTNRRSRAIDPHGSATWMSAVPNIDVRDVGNLSKSKWSLADFRNPANAAGWTEGDGVPGWGRTRGRFEAFLVDVAGVGTLATAEARA